MLRKECVATSLQPRYTYTIQLHAYSCTFLMFYYALIFIIGTRLFAHIQAGARQPMRRCRLAGLPADPAVCLATLLLTTPEGCN